MRRLVWSILVVCGVAVRVAPAAGQDSHAGLVRVAADSIAALRQWDGLMTRMQRDGDLRARQVHEDTLLPGRTHERLSQYYKGVRVYGGDVTRQLDADGVPQTTFGGLYTGIDIDPTPVLTPEQAAGVASQAGRRAAGGMDRGWERWCASTG